MNSVADVPAGQGAGPAPETASRVPPPNPFVGPEPLDVGQALHGRRRETEELSDLLVSKRIVLLFSPSGAGKTSLIRAGLVSKLKDAYEMEALPIVRLGHRDPECDEDASINRYRLATLYALEKLRPESARRPTGDLCAHTLKQYFDEYVTAAIGRDDRGQPHYPLLVFDQFEELFVADPLDVERKREFLEELGNLLKGEAPGRFGGETGAPIWALFAIREDRLAELQPYLDLVPTALSFRYRLDALGVEAARDAIQETAGTDWMAADVPQRLVDDLCTVSVRGIDGRERLQPGRFVEPVQLQVVCRGLWEKIVTRQGRKIEARDVQSHDYSEVDRALRDFFDEEVAAAATAAGVSERKLREWIESQLITASGVRTQTLRDSMLMGKYDDAITRLVDAHLLRSDMRGGREWIELPHDRLVAPVRAANREWSLAHLQPWQARARHWHEASGEHARHLLLPEDELASAKQYAAEHADDLTDEETEFLDASEQETVRDAREHRERMRLRMMVWACVVVVLGVLVTWLFVERRQKAQAEERASVYRGAGSAREAGSTGAALRILLPLRSRAAEADGAGSLSRLVDNAIRQQLTRSPAALVRELQPRNHIVWSLAFAGDGNRLLAGSWDGHISLQDVARPGSAAFVTQDLQSETYAVAVDDAKGLVASTHWDGRLLLWRLNGDGLQRIAVLAAGLDRGRLSTADFSDDGRWLAAGGWGKKIQLWDLADPRRPTHVASFGKGGAPIQSIAFLPGTDDAGGERLASTDYDGNVRVWSVGEHMPVHPKPQREFSIRDHEGRDVGISASAADPSGRYFVAGDTEGFVHMWDLASTDRTRNGIRLEATSHRGGPHDTHVKGIAFSPRADEFVSVGLDGYVVRWALPRDASDLADLEARITTQRFKLGERLFSVAYRPHAREQVAVGGTRSIRLLDLDHGPGPALSAPLPGSVGSTSWQSLSLDAGGSRIAARGDTGPIRFWQRGRDGIREAAGWSLAGASAFALSPDGGRVVTVDCHGAPTEWALREGARPQRVHPVVAGVPGDCGSRTAAMPAFSPDGRFLATADGNVLRVWARNNGNAAWNAAFSSTLLRPVVETSTPPIGDRISTMAFSADSRELAVGAASGGVRLWNMDRPANARGSSPDAYVDVGQRVSVLTFRPDGTALHAGGDDGILTECSVPGLAIRRVLRRHERSITGAAYAWPHSSAERAVLVTADADGYIVEWTRWQGDPDRNRMSTVELAGRGSAPVRAIALSRDGTFLVTAGDDLLAWDFTPPHVLATAEAYADRSYSEPDAGVGKAPPR